MYVAIAEASVLCELALVKLCQLHSLVTHEIVDLTQQLTSSGYACRAVALAALNLPTFPHASQHLCLALSTAEMG